MKDALDGRDSIMKAIAKCEEKRKSSTSEMEKL